MTADDYRAALKALGLTPVKPAYDGATLHVDREGHHTSIPDPGTLSPEERADFIKLLRFRLGAADPPG